MHGTAGRRREASMHWASALGSRLQLNSTNLGTCCGRAAWAAAAARQEAAEAFLVTQAC